MEATKRYTGGGGEKERKRGKERRGEGGWK